MMKPTQKILVVLGVVVVVCTVAAISRERLLAPIAKQVVSRIVAKELGLDVGVDKISGTYFRDLKLTGVRTLKPSETGMLISIGAATIQARYSLPLLLKGVDAFLGELKLELDGARVEMDFSRTGNDPGSEEVYSTANLVLPVIRARNTSIDLRGLDWAFSLTEADLSVAAFDVGLGGIPLTVQAAKSLVELPFTRPQTPALTARGVLNRYFVTVDELEVNGSPAVTEARFDYEPDEPVRCAGSFTGFGGSGRIEALFTEDSTELVWDIKEIDADTVGDILVLTEPFPSGLVTSRGKLAGGFSDPASLVGTVSLEVADGSFRNQAFRRVVLAGTAADGVLRLDSLAAEMAKNVLSTSGVSVPLAPLFAGESEKLLASSKGRFSVRMEDLPGLLDLAGISLPSRFFPQGVPAHRLVAAGSTAAGVLQLDSFEALLGGNSVALSRVSTSLALLVAGDTEKTIRNTRGSFTASLEDIPALSALAGIPVTQEYLPGGMPPHHLAMAGRVTEAGVSLESGTFTTTGGTVALNHLEATWPRTGPLLAGLSLAGSLTANLPDLGATAEIFGIDKIGGDLQAEAAFEGPLKNIHGAIELHGKNLRYREGGVDTLLLVARSESTGWRLVNLEAVRGDDRLTGRGGFSLEPGLFNELVLDLTLGDFQPYLGWFLTGEVPDAHGGLAGHLELSGAVTAPEGSFRAILTEADLAGFAVSRGELRGRLARETVEVSSLQVQTPEGRAELAGSFRHRAWGLPVTGSLERLTLARGESSLHLLAPVAVRLAANRSWSFGEATLQGEAGTLRLAGEISPQTGYDLTIRLSELRSPPFKELFPDLPVEFSGFNLEGKVLGPLRAPEVALKGAVAELLAPDAAVSLAGQFDLLLSSRGLVLKTFSWTTPAGEQIMLTGTIPYDPYGRRFIPEALDVHGLFSVPDLGIFTAFLPENFRVPGLLEGTLKISGTGEHPQATIDFHARKVSLPASFPVQPPGPVSVDAVAVLQDNDLRLETFTVTGDDLNLAIAGNWRQAGNLLKRREAAEGLPGSLDLRGTFSVGEIGWLARGVPAIRRLGGKVAGTMALSGPAAQPDLAVELNLADGEFRADANMPPLRNLQVQLAIARRTATINQFSGSVGGSPFTVSGSVLLPVGGEPEADLRVRGANILLYRSEAVGVRGDADITIRGSFDAPAFAGTLAITDGRLRKNINWLEPLRGIGRSKTPVTDLGGPGGLGISFHNPPLKDATFAIHVSSKNPFRVKSNVARGNLRPDLWLRGTGEIPLLTGVIYIDRSRILLPAGRLSVEAGLIRFPENSPGRPLLEISGSSRILGYDINLTVEGAADEPTISLSSVPPLPQDALLLLLLTGRLPPGAVAQNRGWQEGVKVALYVGKGVLEEWFGGNDLDSEESLLDRFDLVTGRGISRQGNETIGAQYRLAEGVVREGDELYLVAERDIYDEFNTGLRIVFHFK